MVERSDSSDAPWAPGAEGAAGEGGLRRARELVFLEQWLRFYFIREEAGALYLRLPPETMEQLRREHPAAFPLAEALNNRSISPEINLGALCDCLVSGPLALNSDAWAEVLSGSEFRIDLLLLSSWLQAEEEPLDREALSFSAWLERFRIWRSAPEAKDYALRLKISDDAQKSNLYTKVQ